MLVVLIDFLISDYYFKFRIQWPIAITLKLCCIVINTIIFYDCFHLFELI